MRRIISRNIRIQTEPLGRLARRLRGIAAAAAGLVCAAVAVGCAPPAAMDGASDAPPMARGAAPDGASALGIAAAPAYDDRLVATPSNVPATPRALVSAPDDGADAAAAPAADPNASAGDPQALNLLRRAIAALNAAPGFHAEVNAVFTAAQTEASFRMDEETFGSEYPIAVSGDFQPGERMQGKIRTPARGGAAREWDIVAIGGAAYVFAPDAGAWEMFPDADAVFPDLHGLARPPADISRYRNAAIVGDQTLDGVLTHRVQADLDSATILGSAFNRLQVDLWIGADDGLPRRMAMAGETSDSAGDAAGLAASGALGGADIGGGMDFAMTVAYSDFAAHWDILPPNGF